MTSVDTKDFVTDVPAGVMLKYVSAEDITKFIESTREEVQYAISFSKELSNLIMQEDSSTAEGVSMAQVVALLEEIEGDLKPDGEVALARLYRSATVAAATLNMPLPPRFIMIDAITQTAISMLAHVVNTQKQSELAEQIRQAEAAADSAGVEEKQGLPESAKEAAAGGVVAAAIAVVDALLE